MIYDAENRLVEVKKTSVSMATFVYDGDGRRVKSVVNGETIYFAGRHYEFNDSTDEVTKYYFAGASAIAVRKYIIPQSQTLNHLSGDHLGSTSLSVNADTRQHESFADMFLEWTYGAEMSNSRIEFMTQMTDWISDRLTP